ncbi:cytochrome-c oxidase [Geobacillus stearothermophilus]|nr:cytochrome-c oxidase [Geobacillus stearothermophilus]WJQ10568.1 cytochrome-c oxidase [Geobacillus stearothermophilus]
MKMGVKLIKISVVYFVIGVCIGLGMSMTHSFALTPVHVHINLLGWTALTLAGIIYHLFPQAAATKWAKVHFWLHNIGLPVMMIGLVFVVYGNEAFVPVTAIGGVLVVIGVILFAINVLKNVRASS